MALQPRLELFTTEIDELARAAVEQLELQVRVADEHEGLNEVRVIRPEPGSEGPQRLREDLERLDALPGTDQARTHVGFSLPTAGCEVTGRGPVPARRMLQILLRSRTPRPIAMTPATINP